MQITNVSKARLVFATGDVVDAGASLEDPNINTDHFVVKAWIASGLIEVVKTTAKSIK